MRQITPCYTHRSTRRPGKPGGFTIPELLVAISILTLMLLLINDLFTHTTRAMSDGIRQSTVLSNARAVQDRLTRDATAMLGPDDKPRAAWRRLHRHHQQAGLRPRQAPRRHRGP